RRVPCLAPLKRAAASVTPSTKALEMPSGPSETEEHAPTVQSKPVLPIPQPSQVENLQMASSSLHLPGASTAAPRPSRPRVVDCCPSSSTGGTCQKFDLSP